MGQNRAQVLAALPGVRLVTARDRDLTGGTAVPGLPVLPDLHQSLALDVDSCRGSARTPGAGDPVTEPDGQGSRALAGTPTTT
ncbi:hypothetical protein [Streptomyces sp. NBC_00019]|uniref:hypothetical protein n=1 Tax=Streptomyces sp. NBC_00019 TaxID=2975623 RepID=UPI00324F8D57